ncbi:MAG: bifunctional demethylmenaquinone methyltransferase/2-methoxy-6-polyprenyl-1,4-benzoquinol methylase UbiE [Myxococcaceae bacterium]
MIQALFNKIAPRYDLLNRLLSFGQDQFWRKRIINFLPKQTDLNILDVATGTADLAIMILKNAKQVAHVTGIDLATNMLRIGQEKVDKAALGACIDLQTGDAHHLGFPDSLFDVVTVAFGLRNMPGKEQALSEMKRVLKPGGRLIILEFSMPQNAFFKAIYLFYFRHILPFVGGFISGDQQAYRYLNQSVETFSSKEIDSMKAYPLCFGIATIYVADKLA